MKKNLLVLSFLLFTSDAFSQFLLEPYAGYGMSISGEVKGTGTDISYDGPYAGTRLGVAISSIMFGLFYDLMWIDIKEKTGAGTTIIPTDRENFGLFLGANLNSGWRFWGEYLITVKNKYSMDGNIYDKGDGWGLAVGYILNRKVALNLQYRNITLDKSQSGALFNDIVSQELLLTLSFPIFFLVI
jgi:hypothetical protein